MRDKREAAAITRFRKCIFSLPPQFAFRHLRCEYMTTGGLVTSSVRLPLRDFSRNHG